MTAATAHLVLLSVWAGVVAAESVLELLARRRRELRRPVATMHFYLDLFIEAPLLAGVLISGLVLLGARPLTGTLLIKVAFGVAAVLANAVCVVIVVARHRGSDDSLGRRSRWVALTAVAGLPCAAVAFYLGATRSGLLGV